MALKPSDFIPTNSSAHLFFTASYFDIGRQLDQMTQFRISIYGSGHEGAAVLLPGFAIKW